MRANGKPQVNKRHSRADASPARGRTVDADPLGEFVTRLAELGDYATHYAAARFDIAKVRLRNLLVGIAAGLVGLVIAIGVVLTFFVYLLSGLAGGLSVALGDRPWLGTLLAGASGLALVAGSLMLLALRMRNAQRRAIVRKYEERKARQRRRYGKDVGHNGRPGT